MSDSEEETSEKQLKIVLVGEPNVGKTSIIRRFCSDEYTRSYSQTVGADFYINRVALPGKKEVSVRITDVGGLELTGHMLQNYLFNSNMIILVYDITNSASFETMILWIDAISKLEKTPPFVATFGNKCDLEHKRAVRLDKTQSFVEEFQLINFFVSAKTGENVNSAMIDLISRHFGIPLSRIEKEKQATVVRAELTPSTPRQTKNTATAPSNSSVCCLQ